MSAMVSPVARRVAGWAVGLGLFVLIANSWAATPARPQASPPEDDLAGLIARLDSTAEGPGALRPAYDFFLKSMGAYDGESALAVARAMHRRSVTMFDAGESPNAIWSVFCLEGALRRGATEADSEQRFQEASAAIGELTQDARTSGADRLALVQRHAIVAAGFGRRSIERANLGAALAKGGIDGAQITGLERLQSARRNGRDDWETAAALFASLLDRASTEANAQTGPLSIDPATAPWALRGHGLAVLGNLRSTDPMPHTR